MVDALFARIAIPPASDLRKAPLPAPLPRRMVGPGQRRFQRHVNPFCNQFLTKQ